MKQLLQWAPIPLCRRRPSPLILIVGILTVSALSPGANAQGIINYGTLSLAGQQAPGQITSHPGAMGANGNFFVLQQGSNTTTDVEVFEWIEANPGGWWVNRGTSGHRFDTDVYSHAPSARTSTGGFHYTAEWAQAGGSVPHIWGYEPAGYSGSVGGNFAANLSAPSEIMYGNRVYLIDTAGDLKERFVKWSSDWVNLGRPESSSTLLLDQKPCVQSDGRLFVVGHDGKLWQRVWPATGQPYWYGHGRPENDILARFVGAPMSTGKVFVTTDHANGNLYEAFWNGVGWAWHDHGRPYGGLKMLSTPVATEEGKVFVTANYWWDSEGVGTTLLQRYWNGSTWLWFNHGPPPGSGGMVGDAVAAFGEPRVAVKGTNGNFYMLYYDWNSEAWMWKNCGRP